MLPVLHFHKGICTSVSSSTNKSVEAGMLTAALWSRARYKLTGSHSRIEDCSLASSTMMKCHIPSLFGGRVCQHASLRRRVNLTFSPPYVIDYRFLYIFTADYFGLDAAHIDGLTRPWKIGACNPFQKGYVPGATTTGPFGRVSFG